MRISDWSSDVCSSDLEFLLAGEVPIEDGPVGAHRLCDLVDLHVPNASLVEERPGRCQDLGLTLSAARGGSCPSLVRLRSAHGFILGWCNSLWHAVLTRVT